MQMLADLAERIGNVASLPDDEVDAYSFDYDTVSYMKWCVCAWLFVLFSNISMISK